MPTNLYGFPNDNFDHNSSHVLPAMISKFSGAMEKSKHYEVTLWGDGSARREFLHVDDLAEGYTMFVCRDMINLILLTLVLERM